MDGQLGPRAHRRAGLRVGWTQHSVGVQYIRTAAIIQLLLGNMGRPGGGIMAMRGHASIQGSTDVPTLFNLLPGYLPMPQRGKDDTSTSYVDSVRGDKQKGFWHNADTYVVSLLKEYFGDAATPENDFCFDLPAADHRRPRHVPHRHGHGRRGKVFGYFLLGQNPASARHTGGCSGSAWPTSTGWSSATSR